MWKIHLSLFILFAEASATAVNSTFPTLFQKNLYYQPKSFDSEQIITLVRWRKTLDPLCIPHEGLIGINETGRTVKSECDASIRFDGLTKGQSYVVRSIFSRSSYCHASDGTPEIVEALHADSSCRPYHPSDIHDSRKYYKAVCHQNRPSLHLCSRSDCHTTSCVPVGGAGCSRTKADRRSGHIPFKSQSLVCHHHESTAMNHATVADGIQEETNDSTASFSFVIMQGWFLSLGLMTWRITRGRI